MYITPVIIGKIGPFRAKQDTSISRRFSVRTVGAYFPDNDLHSINYPAYYTATWQNEKITSHGVFLHFICYNS
jgi:hypothetical protein